MKIIFLTLLSVILIIHGGSVYGLWTEETEKAIKEGKIYSYEQKIDNQTTLTMYYDEPLHILEMKNAYPECYYDKEGYLIDHDEWMECMRDSKDE